MEKFLPRIISQNNVKSYFLSAIKENKFQGSYLFVGNKGFGKHEFALELAKLLNCKEFISNQNTLRPCGTCSNCKMSNEFINPAINLIIALPPNKGTDKEDDPILNLSEDVFSTYKQNLNSKVSNLYHDIDLPNASQIKIGSIRNIKKKLSMSNDNFSRRVLIIKDAEKMTSEASNALLKTLEEPIDNSLIILTSSNPSALLTTIKSRCKVISFNPIPKEELKDYLVNFNSISGILADFSVNFANGSISKALEFANGSSLEIRDNAIESMRLIMKGKSLNSEIIGLINDLTMDKDKGKIELFLKLLQVWFRDSLAWLYTKDEKYVYNIDKLDNLIKFAEYLKSVDFSQLIFEIDKAINQLYGNVNKNLLLTSLFIKIKRLSTTAS